MRNRSCAAIIAILLLTSCAPKMNGTRMLMRGVSITSSDSDPFTISRIVANASPGDSNCNAYPNKTLRPGETYSTTFLLCGNVTSLSVETDRGTTELDFSK